MGEVSRSDGGGTLPGRKKIEFIIMPIKASTFCPFLAFFEMREKSPLRPIGHLPHKWGEDVILRYK
jgi:hypothetical protein